MNNQEELEAGYGSVEKGLHYEHIEDPWLQPHRVDPGKPDTSIEEVEALLEEFK